ncbi:MAG: preprotein translocase subunit SecE [Defluviicoccus sp.]|nr:preprotein translocase subunit SecE [Defluviicoccus sp.]
MQRLTGDEDSRIDMAKISPIEFIQQVRREVARVTWPSRRETAVTTVMVFIFVALAALFFFVVDQILSVAVRAVLGLGG